MTINQWTIWHFTVRCQSTWGKQQTFIENINWTWILCHTHSLITSPVSHPQSHHKSCVTPTVSSQILCHTQSHHKSCVTPTVSSQILCHTQSHHKSCVTPTVTSQILYHTRSLISNPVSHPQSHHKHINIGRTDLQSCLFHGNRHNNQIHNI